MNNTFDRFVEHMFLKPDMETQIPRESLDSTVFQFYDDGRAPVLFDSIKAQIITDIQALEASAPITNFYLVGDILTPYYAAESDLNIYIEVDPQVIDNLSTAELFYNLRRMNNRYATNTKHRIRYHLHTQQLDVDQEEAVYDIMNDAWVKRAETVSPSIEEYLTKFNETLLSIDNDTGKVLRDRINIQDIRSLNTVELETLRYEIQQKYDRLQTNLENVVKLIPGYNAIERLLNDNTLTILEIQLWGQRLPDFIRRMFYEKFYVMRFIQQLDELLVDEDEFDVKALVNNNEMGKQFKEAN